MQKTIKLVFLLLVGIGWFSLAYAFSSGPPSSHTGAPNEETCMECHSTFPLNSGGGSVKIIGLPDKYTPGTKYSLTVTVAQSDRMRWGFQMTALTDDASAAGLFMISDPTFTQMIIGNIGGKLRSYVEHTSAGSRLGTPNSASFKVDWMAPASGVGNITFYAAGNAANGNGQDTGDNIYTTSVKVADATAAAPPPTISAVNPTHGPADGGTTVTVTGTNFVSGITTTFDGLATQTTFVNGTTIRAVTPAHATGAVDVTVKNSDGLTATTRAAFTYDAAPLPPPTLTSISPTSGSTSGGTDVTLTGNNFVQGAIVLIGPREATITSVSATRIQAKTQPNTAGAVDVTVKHPDGQQAVLKGAFTYVGNTPSASVQVLTPNGGEVLSSGGLPFTITWKVMSSSNATQQLDLSTDGGVSFPTVIASGLTADQTSFTYSVPAGIVTDKARVRITLTDGSTTVSDVSDADLRIVAAPAITALSPGTASPNTQIAKLKVTGSGFQSGAVVEINAAAVGTKFKSATSMLAKKVNTGPAGTLKVRVRNPDGGVSTEKTIEVK